MRLLAPAKINLHLRVGRRRADGFHPLLTWMSSIALFDQIDITPAEGPSRLTCDDPALPVDDKNLVCKAMVAVARVAPPQRPVSIHLQKRIPMGAGLGGGSSDAARTLLGLNAMWKLRQSVEDLAGLAARLGSDVPFFFYLPCAVCRGRGEVVQPAAPPRPRWAVVILPGFGVPTSPAYARFDEMGLGDDLPLAGDCPWTAWASLPASELMRLLANDLEPAAFSLVPALGELWEAIQRNLARPVRMSGSGSSLFTLYDDADEAITAASAIQGQLAVKAMSLGLAPPIRDELDAPRPKL